MKFLIPIFSLIAFNFIAQTNLTFDKRFVECEDNWVTFNEDKDSTYSYGFIYIDEEAGLTFNLEGKFKVKPSYVYEVEKNKEASVKFRLEPNNVKVAVIPASMYKDLQIDSIPDWLKFYKNNLNSAKRLYTWGYMYNGWNECEKGLEFLLKAKSVDPNFDGLAVELAFSYNCLNEFDKALNVLGFAINEEPSNEYINKEYIYTLIKTMEIDRAIVQYNKSIELNIKNTHNAENCFNILGYYYKKRDQKNFKFWEKELKKWPNDNEQITEYVGLMKKDMK
jgi:tetratricopeptide (TPR) repeat protein